MNIKPMPFDGLMVKALFDGRKTSMRIPVDQECVSSIEYVSSSDETNENIDFLGLSYCSGIDDEGNTLEPEYRVYCTEYPDEGSIGIGQGVARIGDLFYVQEPCYVSSDYRLFRALDAVEIERPSDQSWWKMPIGAVAVSDVPVWASRLTLKVTSVHIERIQHIKPSEAKTEGFNDWTGFAFDWTSRYAAGSGLSWSENPLVWVVGYEVIHQNVNEYLENQK